MTKGKDVEKNTVPLFPRLHLNDTEKGGPRAPPRNKMALYEQLSIPSLRFKKGAVSTNSNNTATMTPPTSSEGSSQQRDALFSAQRSVSGQSTGQSDNCSPNIMAPRGQPQLEKKTEGDDFRVPVFSQTNVHGDFTRYRSNNSGMKLIHSSHVNTHHSIVHAPNGGDETKRRSNVLPPRTQDSKSHIVENVEEFILNNQKSVEDISNSSSTKITELSACQSDAYACGEPEDNSAMKSRSTLLKADLSLLSPHKAERHSTSRVLRDAMNVAAGSNNGDSAVSKLNNRSEGQRSIVDEEYLEDSRFGSLPVESAHVGDHTSDETSMVDCAAGLNLSPDDVVDIIGQKHFWKARKAIVNQQRVFAVQVFELHRLIEVQKLLAGSPDLLHNSSLLGKSIQSSSPKLPIPMECIVKRPPDAINPKNGSDKQNHRMECSAENNVVGKESHSSEQNGGHQPCSKPTSVNSPMRVIPNDSAMSSWCQNQVQGQQWLIPMMSPSEGLVYKPYYPSPGMMNPYCGGGCGPPHMAGNFVSSGYGAVACQQFQGMTMPPFAFHSGPQGFFPPGYANIPFVNHSIADSGADQTNRLATSGLPVQSPSMDANNTNSQYHRRSCKSSSRQKDEFDGAIRDSNVQASTESRGRGNSSSGGSNVLPLLTTDTPSCNTRPQHEVAADRPTRVIKVVPHGGVSATESVARIFQSIQQERKRHHT